MDSVGPQRRPQLAGRVGGRGVGPVFAAGFAAVEGQRAEGAFQEGIGGVVAGGLPAEAVEGRFVAHHLAADAADAGGPELAGEGRDGAADAAVVAGDEAAGAERGVAAAVQVEVAFPDPSGGHVAAPVDGRG